MIHIVFRSRLTTLLSYVDIQGICLALARNNRKADITGFMVECGGLFLGSIEGPPHNIAETFERIRRDPRHESVEIIYAEQDATQRRFGAWSMNVMFLDDDALWRKVFRSGISCDELLDLSVDPTFALGVLAVAYRYACSAAGIDSSAKGKRTGRKPRPGHMIRH